MAKLETRTGAATSVVFLLALFALQQHLLVLGALLWLEHRPNLVLLPVADGLHLRVHLLLPFVELRPRILPNELQPGYLPTFHSHPLFHLPDHHPPTTTTRL